MYAFAVYVKRGTDRLFSSAFLSRILTKGTKCSHNRSKGEREMNIKNCWQQKSKVQDLRDVVILDGYKFNNRDSSKDRKINYDGDKMYTTMGLQPRCYDPGDNRRT